MFLSKTFNTIKSLSMNIFIYAHNILSKCKCKKRKNIDAIAPTSYNQILSVHSIFYTIVLWNHLILCFRQYTNLEIQCLRPNKHDNFSCLVEQMHSELVSVVNIGSYCKKKRITKPRHEKVTQLIHSSLSLKYEL